MNLAISSANTVSDNGNLLVLTDSDNLKWTESLLDAPIANFLKGACKRGVSQIFLPTENKIILVQVLKKDKDKDRSRELARKEGNEILDIINKNKIEEITVINHSSTNFTYDYIEGMALGSYQFLKYYNDPEKKKIHLGKLKSLGLVSLLKN